MTTPHESRAFFQTTRWSVVLAAQDSSSRNATASLEVLCRQYWKPLHAYIRLRGHPVHDAEDLTQAFFARLLEKDWLQAADRTQGRFRTFLLMALKRFLANERDRATARKRGGAAEIISLDAETAGSMPIPDPNAPGGESFFDREWALALLETVMTRLREEHEHSGRGAEYEALKPCLTAVRGTLDYAALGQTLGMEPASARSAAHRLRKRFRDLFREEVARTVASPADVDDELRSVIAALGTL